ncbi:MAG TPA: hypothetical protein VH592_19015 [Gemmataceae bacterium]
MKRFSPVLSLSVLVLVPSLVPAGDEVKESLAQLERAFGDYSGSRLVFNVKDLPEGTYHDRMPCLNEDGRMRAARIALREIRKLPPRYLEKMGLKAIGIFAACISNQGDGFRPYDEPLRGYRFFGIYNGKNALAAAYYSDTQLPTTLHHEIFHHVDATIHGQTRYTVNFVRDERFEAVLAGADRYPALHFEDADLAALRKLSKGHMLEKAVSSYAEKSVGEDKAETARYLMTALPDALVQMATRPELAGSQRMLHVLHKYGQAIPDGPGVGWFVSVALDRTNPAATQATHDPVSHSPPGENVTNGKAPRAKP